MPSPARFLFPPHGHAPAICSHETIPFCAAKARADCLIRRRYATRLGAGFEATLRFAVGGRDRTNVAQANTCRTRSVDASLTLDPQRPDAGNDLSPTPKARRPSISAHPAPARIDVRAGGSATVPDPGGDDRHEKRSSPQRQLTRVARRPRALPPVTPDQLVLFLWSRRWRDAVECNCLGERGGSPFRPMVGFACHEPAARGVH